MLLTIIAILFVLWLFGFVFSFGGGLIHLLIIAIIIILIVKLLRK